MARAPLPMASWALSMAAPLHAQGGGRIGVGCGTGAEAGHGIRAGAGARARTGGGGGCGTSACCHRDVERDGNAARGPRRYVLGGGELGLGGDDDSGGEGRGGESGAEGGLSGSGHSSRLSDKGGAEDSSRRRARQVEGRSGAEPLLLV
jgi:hypothetical protein